ncbi:MAG TPA: DUF4127 family protein [Candidatus Acidoferrales bacterium]|nr:DUF4127 family protein [Candidatus Acidoferrales bacterium]
MKVVAFVSLLSLLFGFGVASAQSAPVVIVPIDDRPVTRQLPMMLGGIAGIPVVEPPRALIGNYLTPGDPEELYRWLTSDATKGADAFVLSSDMMVYGGLVASRIPGVPAWLGYSRLRFVSALRGVRPNARFYGFGTVMRLAPTGVPAIGDAASFFAAGKPYELITQYANNPNPELAQRIGPILNTYIATRRRNLDVDLFALQLTAEGGFDRFVLGQDDAGPHGLHIADLESLQRARQHYGWGLLQRTSIEPGADELAMIMEANAFAARANWEPRFTVTWSQPGGPAMEDSIEYAPFSQIAEEVIRSCGGRVVSDNPDIELFVRVRDTDAEQEKTFTDKIASDVAAGKLVTVVDLTFFGAPLEEQRALVQDLIARKVAGRLAGFASWNTAANSLGTAVPAAIAVGVGRRLGTFNKLDLADFLLDRYIDDYAFHDFVRPALNDELTKDGVDHTYLLPDVAARTASENRALLWPHAVDLLDAIFPDYRDGGLTITLPWDRTFETEIDVRLGLRGES